MPFGRPVVPDEKSRAAPRDSSGIGVSGNQANRYVEIDHPAAITRAIGDETAFDARTLRHRRECRFALRSRGDQDLRFAVVEDVGHLVCRQIRVDAGVVEARTFAGAAAFDIAGVVLHKDRVVVEPAETARPQKMGEPVAPPLQLGIGNRFAALRHDEGRLLRSDRRLQTRIHRPLSRARHAGLDPLYSGSRIRSWRIETTIQSARKGPGGMKPWKRSGCWHSPMG